MLKYSSILLFAVVAISWSQVECRAPLGAKNHYFATSGVAKRKAEDESSDEEFISAETGELVAKGLLAVILESTADTSTERRELSEKFAKAMKTKYDSIDDYAKRLFEIYQEVTGKDPTDLSSSESDESTE